DKARAAEVAKLIDGFSGDDKARAAEVAKLIDGFKKEREETAAAWEDLLATMASAKGERPSPAAKVVEEVEVEEEAEIEEVSLEDKVLEFINRNPEGVRVGDMEGPLGVTRMRLGQVTKKLLNEGKVRREEGIYFPL
ncbi:MAG: hypothetical protein KJ821_03695, partial [Actinobacteria bacterium]|nr:hypothetical protein [Actinomycetota bacterium]